jgi:hypothetical protein
MSNTIENFDVPGNPSTEGMEDLFQGENLDVTQALPQEVEEVTESETELLSIAEASRLKNIPYTTFYKQVKAGKHPTATDSDGKLCVVIDRKPGETDQATQRTENLSGETEHVTASVSGVTESITSGENPGNPAKHLDVIQQLNEKLIAASYRIGYLESQVREREGDIQDLKLLTDRLQKPTRWQQFVRWFMGR